MRVLAPLLVLLAGCPWVPRSDHEERFGDTSCTDGPTWFADVDGDGFGQEGTDISACAQPAGFVDTAGDCDDAEPARNPAAEERCDGVDNDCDGTTDQGAVDAELLYPDEDGDGFGGVGGQVAETCPRVGWSPTADDCDDLNGQVHPGAPEICDGVDNNCDGMPLVHIATDFATSDGLVLNGDAGIGDYGGLQLTSGTPFTMETGSAFLPARLPGDHWQAHYVAELNPLAANIFFHFLDSDRTNYLVLGSGAENIPGNSIELDVNHDPCDAAADQVALVPADAWCVHLMERPAPAPLANSIVDVVVDYDVGQVRVEVDGVEVLPGPGPAAVLPHTPGITYTFGFSAETFPPGGGVHVIHSLEISCL